MTRTIVAAFLQLAHQDPDRAWVEANKFKSTWARLILLNVLVSRITAKSNEARRARIALVTTAGQTMRNEPKLGAHFDRASDRVRNITSPTHQPESTCPAR